MTVGGVGLNGGMYDSQKQGLSQAANNLGLVAERFGRDEFDLVGVGRALLADPEWANKIKSGHAEAIVPFTPQVLGALC